MAAATPIETDALVIGAGPVGLFQVFQLGLLEIACHVVDALPYAGGQCVELYGDKPIYDIPGTPVTSGAGLAEALLRQAEPFAPRFHFNVQAASLARQDDGRLLVGLSDGSSLLARTVFIAAGVGAFVPRRLSAPGFDAHEGTRLFYHPPSLERFASSRVAVLGGDDAALQAALNLADRGAKVTLVYRRDVFSANEETVALLRERVAAGALQLCIGQSESLDARELRVNPPEGDAIALPVDVVLAYTGISPRLGPIADWGLAMERKQLPVDTEQFQTQEPGVYAVGDINTYPGKKKLIVCGFHEATLAAWGAAAVVFPGKSIPLQYTTTSTRLHQLLRV